MEKCIICGTEINTKDGDNLKEKLCLSCDIDAEDVAFEATLDVLPED